MIKIVNFSKIKNLQSLSKILDRRKERSKTNTSIVNVILKNIKKNKIKSKKKFEKKFSQNIKLFPSKKEIKISIKSLNPKVKFAIDQAYSRIKKFHQLQKIKEIKYIDKLKNKIKYKHVPINNLGIYVPANLPSTLLMNAIPANIAGVKNIVLANPRICLLYTSPSPRDED